MENYYSFMDPTIAAIREDLEDLLVTGSISFVCIIIKRYLCFKVIPEIKLDLCMDFEYQETVRHYLCVVEVQNLFKLHWLLNEATHKEVVQNESWE